MSQKEYEVKSNIVSKARITGEDYDRLYKESLEDAEKFWDREGSLIDWTKKYDKVKESSFHKEDFHIRWYEGGKLNVCYNCVDRHVEKRGKETALTWEGDEPTESIKVSYEELKLEVSRMANVLKSLGVSKGDRVIIYMPMILEGIYAMLSCARIGAVHSVVFGGFSSDSLADRINDCGAKLVIVSDYGRRGGKLVKLKENVDRALTKTSTVSDVLVVRKTDKEITMLEGRDREYKELVKGVSDECSCEEMDAEDPLFILYTSGSTGKPKGVLHTSGGYLVYASSTFRNIFDYKDGEIFWCTADIGWVTGHSYIVYGPLSNGANALVFEGVPNYPDYSRFWQVVDKHKVNIFYTAPTAIRSLMKEGDSYVEGSSLSSLRIIGTVGEPINAEAWEWYYKVVGKENCPVVDTWWQTETGATLITTMPGAKALVPGMAGYPYFGIDLVIIDSDGNEVKGEGSGNLYIKDSWPGIMRTVYGDHERFFDTYFSQRAGYYFSGDGVRRDSEGRYQITGRVDDVINVSGHRIGTAEVESALVLHEAVAESAVVGFPHDIKGQGIYAYVTLKTGKERSDDLKKELVLWVRKEIGPIATIDYLQWAPSLPKTRSGKIMRRILRKIAAGLDSEEGSGNFGDTSTLLDETVVDELVRNRER